MILTWRVALLVESRPNFADEVRCDAATLGGRVETNAVQPIAERVGDAQRLLGLVVERVDEDDARHVRGHVAVERLGRLDRVAKDEHERVRHRAGWGEAGEARARGRRCADAAADDRRVVERVGHLGMDVARAERDDRLRRGRVHALARSRCPAGRLGHDPEQCGLEQAEGAVSRANAQHDFLGRDQIAVAKRLDDRVSRVAVRRQHVREQHLGLVDAAQDRVAAAEDLHHHDRIEALLATGSPRRCGSRRPTTSPDRMSRDGARRIPARGEVGSVTLLFGPERAAAGRDHVTASAGAERAESTSARAADETRVFGRFTGRTMPVMQAEDTLERRIVTVLFADLVGFTTLSEQFDAEDVAAIQDRYFAAVRDTIGRYGGRLEKFIGDAAMAVFGVPRSRDDDAERAVRAGLALISAVQQLGVAARP